MALSSMASTACPLPSPSYLVLLRYLLPVATDKVHMGCYSYIRSIMRQSWQQLLLLLLLLAILLNHH